MGVGTSVYHTQVEGTLNQEMCTKLAQRAKFTGPRKGKCQCPIKTHKLGFAGLC